MSDWDKMTNEAKNAAFYAGRDNGEPIDTNTFISSWESKEDPVPDERDDDRQESVEKSDTFEMTGTDEKVVIE